MNVEHPVPWQSVATPGPAGGALRWWGLAGLVWLALVSPVRALEVPTARWGFDGRAMNERFNLLSVRIENPGIEPFDGEIVLRKSRGLDPVDAPIVEPIYLAPGTGRWVQFYAYVGRPNLEVWMVSWGKGTRNRAEMPQAGEGRDASVVLESEGSLNAVRVGGKIFPEELFPSRSTACDALARVVLDHEPRWNDAQQQAFLDWMRLGGEAHIVQDATRKFPRFTGPLDVLNEDRPVRNFGAGRVWHHDLTVNALDEKTFRRTILRLPPAPEEISPDVPPEVIPTAQPANARFFTNSEIEVDGTVLRQLKGLTRAEHNWVLIHLLSLLFLLLVFPGFWRLGQDRLGDYRLVFGALLGTVALFSLAFLYIGSRGAGEATAVDTLLLVRPIDGERFDVTGWSNAFVVAGGDYVLTHEGQGRCYSTGQTEEDVRGLIRNGADAGLSTDMPPFSARTLLHRAVVTAPPLTLTPGAIVVGQEARSIDQVERKTYIMGKMETIPILQRFEARASGAGFPPQVQRGVAVFGKLVYPLRVVPNRGEGEEGATLDLLGQSQQVAAFLHADQGLYGMQRWGYEPPRDRKNLFDLMLESAVQRSLGILDVGEALAFELPTDRIRVLLYGDLPTAFRLKSDRFGNQFGRCLYSVDIPLGETR